MEASRDGYEDSKFSQDGRMLSMDQLDQLDGVDDQLEDSLDAFANVGQGLEGVHRTEMLNYWQQAIDEIEHIAEDGTGHECFKSTALPLARIKKVMKTDSEVRMISAEAPILFAKGCDIFITELTMRAWIHAEENKRRTLQRSDIATAIQKSDVFDFLIDIVPREEAQQRKSSSHHRAPHSEGGNAANDSRSSQGQSSRHPREVQYVGDSRNMSSGSPNTGPVSTAMHSMNLNMNNVGAAPGSYGPAPANGIPSGVPGAMPGGMGPEGGIPPQQFAQFGNRFPQFQPQHFQGGVPPPAPLQHPHAPPFNQFPGQYGGGPYFPQLQQGIMPGAPQQAGHDPSRQQSLQVPQAQQLQQGQHVQQAPQAQQAQQAQASPQQPQQQQQPHMQQQQQISQPLERLPQSHTEKENRSPDQIQPDTQMQSPQSPHGQQSTRGQASPRHHSSEQAHDRAEAEGSAEKSNEEEGELARSPIVSDSLQKQSPAERGELEDILKTEVPEELVPAPRTGGRERAKAPAQKEGLTQPPQTDQTSPSQKSREQLRYDSEFQYGSSYGEPVDVTYGQNF